MLTAYLDYLQHASPAIKVASCLLSALGLFAVCFTPGLIVSHVRAYRASR